MTDPEISTAILEIVRIKVTFYYSDFDLRLQVFRQAMEYQTDPGYRQDPINSIILPSVVVMFTQIFYIL